MHTALDKSLSSEIHLQISSQDKNHEQVQTVFKELQQQNVGTSKNPTIHPASFHTTPNFFQFCVLLV